MRTRLDIAGTEWWLGHVADFKVSPQRLPYLQARVGEDEGFLSN